MYFSKNWLQHPSEHHLYLIPDSRQFFKRSGIGNSALRCSDAISPYPLGSLFIVHRARTHFYFMAKLNQLRYDGLIHYACFQDSYFHYLLFSNCVVHSNFT